MIDEFTRFSTGAIITNKAVASKIFMLCSTIPIFSLITNW